MRCIALVNARSGRSYLASRVDNVEAARRALESAGVDARIVAAKGSAFARALEAAAASRPEGLIACGGDGTVSAVAAACAKYDLPLGILPLGTYNLFARFLDLPLDPEEAARTIAAGRTHRVDMGQVGNRPFVSHISVGIYPHFIREREMLTYTHHWSRLPAIMAGLVRAFGRFPLYQVELTGEGEDSGGVRHFVTPFLLAGNHRNAIQPLALPPDGARSLRDGSLSLYVNRNATRPRLVWTMLRALTGKIDLEEDFRLLESRRFEIRIRGAASVLTLVDGELYRLPNPLRVEAHPGRLMVFAPGARE